MENALNIDSKPTNVFESQIQDIFKKETSDIDTILSIVSILAFKNIRDKSILSLYNISDVNTFTKVLLLFEGRTITFPSREEIEELFVLATCYYYREVENMTWEDIKAFLPFEIKSTTYGLKINNLSSLLRKKMEDLILGAKSGQSN